MPRKKTKRADGRYEIKRKMPDGKYRHFLGKTIAEATAKYEAAYQKAILEGAKLNGGATFREMAQKYEKYITGDGSPVKRGTKRSYKRHLKYFIAYFGDTLMKDIDTQAVCAYMERRKIEGKSIHTITNEKSTLSCVFKFWCANYHGYGDPVLLAIPPAGMKRGKRKEPTKEQQDIIHAHPEGCGFWAQLFEFTGLRLSEANGLKWEDVDFDTGLIHVSETMPWDINNPYLETPKSDNGYRDVPILTPFRQILIERRKGHPDTDYVMSDMGRPLTKSEYQNRWISYCRQVGLADFYLYEAKIPASKTRPAHTAKRKIYRAKVTAHQFRHLYASNLFYAGIPDKIAQKLMGHADIMTTRRIYQELRDAEDQKFIDKLDQYVQNKVE